MYAQFFGLTQAPFSIAPDPHYLFMSERHREALAHLLYGLRGGGGVVLLSGAIGAGKTTVCRCFLEQLPAHCNVAYIVNPKLTVAELLGSICDEFHIPVPVPAGGSGVGAGLSVKDYLDPLNTYLLRTHAVGQNNLLIIDEAQLLAPEVLEQLRLLTNLETHERKLLQIVLIGQPELRRLLARPELEQLAQRVIARFHLEPLSELETAQYIAHRLAVAGRTGASPFDARALRRIYLRSRGVPRRINLLCDRALLGAYASGRANVDRRIVEQAAAEVFGDPVDQADRAQARAPAAATRWRALQHATLGGALVLGALWFGGSVVERRGGAVAKARPTAVVTAVPAVAPASASTLPLPSPLPSMPATAVDATGPQLLHAAFRDEASAWRELGAGWQLAPGAAGEALCTSASRQQVRCFRTPTPTLALIRQLGRPGIVTLRAAAGAAGAAGAPPAYAVLTGLGANRATLRLNGASLTVPLALLATLWQGDFATLWRAPPGYVAPLGPGARGALVDALGLQLAGVDGGAAPPAGQAFDAALQARVHAFQLAQGLRANGRAGPTTFMQLNQARGVAEPRLLSIPTLPLSTPTPISPANPTNASAEARR